ncbi:MauE/DoxX family redox-associated membrane protein [Flavobacterium pedocola]
MVLQTKFRNIIVRLISSLYIALFMYAAISKLLDFENFKIQLGQSPLLSAFATEVAIAIPLIEIIIAILLILPRLIRIGLYASYLLMVMFTTYIYIILNYSQFIPCSCGGILEKMTWEQHMAFNITFLFLVIIAILFSHETTKPTKIEFANKYIRIPFFTILGSGIVTLLYVASENIVQYHNTFIRRFPQHLASPQNEIDLKFNSYYFAGSGDGKIYLGNSTAPLQMMVVDTALQKQELFRITLKEKNLPFQTPHIKVYPPYFSLYEGTVPYFFKGSVQDWKGKLQTQSGTYFSQVEPIDSVTVATRYIKPKTGENLIGTKNLKTNSEQFGNHLLQKQIDGVFDTDGSLHYNADLKKIIYVHRYRNEFIVADNDLNLEYRGNTIDTVSHAQIKLSTNKDKVKTFTEPPLIVNKASATSDNYLYINSALPGQFETTEMWKQASIIDVYDLTKKSYLASFYLYQDNGKKLRSFYIVGKNVFVLIGNKIIRYQLRADIIKTKQQRH